MAVIESKILSVNDLLSKKGLSIPGYQRPYKWTHKNIVDLLSDINYVIEKGSPDFKYRVGTIILHDNNGILDVVDGQQRVISLILIRLCISSITQDNFKCSLLKKEFASKISQKNIHDNYQYIENYISERGVPYTKSVNEAMKNNLEVVVLIVSEVTEAFQLFDSQNTRGKELDPTDLLKAYHLREMKNPHEMRRAVEKWDAKKPKDISDLFGKYLFPVQNWMNYKKTFPFTTAEIDLYKGIPKSSPYTYAKRAVHAVPYFQISQSFVAGGDFFKMVEHYIELLQDIKTEIKHGFEPLCKILNKKSYIKSTGFLYAKQLFYCVLLCYYDKFGNFDNQSVKKLFKWAFMLRVDLDRLGFDSINKYAVGERHGRNEVYSNYIPMFEIIKEARLHTEISNMPIRMKQIDDDEDWYKLYRELQRI